MQEGLVELPTTLPDGKAVMVRKFGDANIQRHLDDALLGADNHSRFATVLHFDTKSVIWVAKYENGPWTVAGYAGWDKEEGKKAGGEIRFEI